ncbi:hypothetical protein ES703_77157 [subsurface metagenome]
MRKDGDQLTFNVDNGEEFLPVFIKESGIKIARISLHHPTLEDVFLKLTGREIREEEVGDSIKEHLRQQGGGRMPH